MRCIEPTIAAAIVILSVSCGNPPGLPDAWEPEWDGGFDVETPDPPTPPAPASTIERPSLTPCPSGWRELPPDAEDDLATCEPWPEGGWEACEVGDAHFPGERSCAPIGSPCPAGIWPTDLPTAATLLWVNADAEAGGAGSLESPFTTVSAAVEAATEETVIAVAKGTYQENVRMAAGTTLWGACTAETRIVGPESDPARAVVLVQGVEANLHNLTITGPRIGVLVSGSRASAHLAGVLIDGAEGVGLSVTDQAALAARALVVAATRERSSDGDGGQGLDVRNSARVELSRAVLRENRFCGASASTVGTSVRIEDTAVLATRSREADGYFGQGLLVYGGARLELLRSVVEGNRETAIEADGEETSLLVTDVVLRDTDPDAVGSRFGCGLFIYDGAEAELERVTVDRTRYTGVFVRDAGTTVEIADLVVRGTWCAAANECGRGMEVLAGAELRLERGQLSDNTDFGVVAADPGTLLELNDLFVSGTRSNGENSAGGGLFAFDDAEVTVDGGRFDDNRYAGVTAAGAGTSLTIADVVVEGTRARENDLEQGRGLVVQNGARTEIERLELIDNQEVAMFVAHPGTVLVAMDLWVGDTVARAGDGLLGAGLYMHQGAVVELSRGVFERNREVAVRASGLNTRLALADVVVRDTLGAERSGRFGRGLEANEGALVEGVRVLVEGNRESGMVAFDPETTVEMSHVTVRDTLAMECTETTECADATDGTGVGTYNGAHIELETFLITQNVFCGAQLAVGASGERGGTMDLVEGAVSHNLIGVNIQTIGFDIDRLMDRVSYHDNERNLDTDELPVPDLGY